MGQSLLINHAANGGFPEPLEGEPVRVVAARHDGCKQKTRVCVPGSVPARAVRRVHCMGCDRDVEADSVVEVSPPSGRPPRPPVNLSLPKPSMPSMPSVSLPRLPAFDPSSRVWQLISVPIAAALVIGGLLLIQGGNPDTENVNADSAPLDSATGIDAGAGAAAANSPVPSGGEKFDIAKKPSRHTELIQGSSFRFALPSGWEQVDPPDGATFSAIAPAGDADLTLWIEEDPKLTLDRFVKRSLLQLESLAGSARVVEQVSAPTPEDTVVRLAADSPTGQPTYEALLRIAGPYRYYLATTLEPDASADAISDVELATKTFTPEGGV